MVASRPHHVRRGPRLDRERERLLPLPSARTPARRHRLGGRARRRHPLDPARGARRRRRDGRCRPLSPSASSRQRARRGLPGLVRGPVPHRRHHPALRHQQRRPVLLRRDAAEPRATSQALPLRDHRQHRLRRLRRLLIFSQRFSQLLADFLLFIIVWVAPWCAIYLVDYLLRRGRYDSGRSRTRRAGSTSATAVGTGRALIALAVGMLAVGAVAERLLAVCVPSFEPSRRLGLQRLHGTVLRRRHVLPPRAEVRPGEEADARPRRQPPGD